MEFFDSFQLTTLMLFYVAFIGRMLHLLFGGTNPFVIGSGKEGFGKIVETCFMIGLLVWSLEIVVHSCAIDFHIFPDFLYIVFFERVSAKIIGCGLIAAGLLIFISSLISFGRSWRIGIDTRNPGTLVTTGIFSLTRNPIFVFLDLYFLGTWLVYPNLFFGISAVLTIIGIHWQILQEEKFLARQYGKKYLDYMNTVRRYI